jgi:hypothetical protein
LAVTGGSRKHSEHQRSDSSGSVHSRLLSAEQVRAVRAAALAVQHHRKHSPDLTSSEGEGVDRNRVDVRPSTRAGGGSGAVSATCTPHSENPPLHPQSPVTSPSPSPSLQASGDNPGISSSGGVDGHNEATYNRNTRRPNPNSDVYDAESAARMLAGDMRHKEKLLAQEAALKEQLESVREEKRACDRRIALNSMVLRQVSDSEELAAVHSDKQEMQGAGPPVPPVPPPPPLPPPGPAGR